MRIVGIDIGSYSIKLAELDSSSGQLVKYHEHVLNPDPTKDHHLEVVDYIRKNFGNAQGLHLIVGLKQDEVTHRRTHFPFRERFKIEKSLSFDLEEDIPFSSENAIFDFKIIGYEGNGCDLLALASPKSCIQKTLQLCRDGGFEPNSISMEAAALNNMVENWAELPPARETNVELPAEAGAQYAEAFLHLGHTHCVLIIRSQNRLIDIKTFDGGGFELAKSVSTTYNMPLSEAIKQVNSKGFILINPQGATKDQTAFSDVFKKSLAGLAQNIRLAILDTESRLKIEIKSLKISGGLANVKNVQAFFTQQLNVATNVFEPKPFQISIQGTNFDTQRGLIALGLAMEGLRKARNPSVNFLKNEFQRENKSLKNFLDKYGLIAKYAAALYLIVLVFAFAKDMTATYVAERADQSLVEQGRAMKLRLPRLRIDAEKRIAAFRDSEKQKEFVSSLNRIVSALDVLKEVSSKAPSREALRMELSRLRIDDQDVSISGTIAANASLEQFKAKMGTIAKGNVEATSGGSTDPNNTDRRGFNMAFKVSRTGGNK